MCACVCVSVLVCMRGRLLALICVLSVWLLLSCAKCITTTQSKPLPFLYEVQIGGGKGREEGLFITSERTGIQLTAKIKATTLLGCRLLLLLCQLLLKKERLLWWLLLLQELCRSLVQLHEVFFSVMEGASQV